MRHFAAFDFHQTSAINPVSRGRDQAARRKHRGMNDMKIFELAEEVTSSLIRTALVLALSAAMITSMIIVLVSAL